MKVSKSASDPSRTLAARVALRQSCAVQSLTGYPEVVVGLSAVVLHPGAEGSLEPEFVLAHARLGNVATIAYIRKRAGSMLPQPALLIDRVLYSGSHSGDEIEPELAATLRGEVELLMKDEDASVRSFCVGMSKLCNIASEQNLPILFV